MKTLSLKLKELEFDNVTGNVTFCNDTLPVRTLATNLLEQQVVQM